VLLGSLPVTVPAPGPGRPWSGRGLFVDRHVLID
jgi:hypothetical protein